MMSTKDIINTEGVMEVDMEGDTEEIVRGMGVTIKDTEAITRDMGEATEAIIKAMDIHHKATLCTLEAMVEVMVADTEVTIDSRLLTNMKKI